MPVNRMLLSTKKWCYCLIKRHPWKSGFKMVSCVIKDSSYSPFDPSVCIRTVKEKLLVTQVCLFVTPGTSLPGSSVHGILQARIPEWVAISFSRGSSQSGNQTHVSYIGRQVLHL